MGKRDKQEGQQEDLLKTLGDFTSKENWDSFFSIRGSDDAFEWYAEWDQLQEPLLSHLASPPFSAVDGGTAVALTGREEMQILVPGCGNSKLSEHLYDAGYKNITNVDFSKVVISNMLRRNVRARPEMKWRIMDMTNMQFLNESFDAIIDKGGLDALMEPEIGPKLGNRYLSEVRRILKTGGKFVCLTLAESHVLAQLFPKFRCGWKMSLHAIPHKPSQKPRLQTFMVIAEKSNPANVCQILSAINQSSIDCKESQARGLFEALENENGIRSLYSDGSDVLYSLEDLKIGAEGNLAEHKPGRRLQVTLGEAGESRFVYQAVLLDAQKEFGPFLYQCGVFLVPKARAHEWLFTAEEGQWVVVESSKAARLIMIFLDSSHMNASMDDIQMDLSPLVKQLAPGDIDDGAQIPFMAAGDGIKQRKIVHQVTSEMTGPITIDDVVYEKVDDDLCRLFQSKEIVFRRLTFQRTECLVQSEAVVSRDGSDKIAGQTKHQKTQSKSKRKGNQRKFGSHASGSSESGNSEVDHSYLASSYHTGIISGFVLISSFLRTVASDGGMVKAIVIGLGAGLLPMFLHKHLPLLDVEVVELDPVVVDLAKNYFGFREDKHLKVNIADGIHYVQAAANLDVASHQDNLKGEPSPASGGACNVSHGEGKISKKIDILVVDVDSSDPSSGLTCPATDFVTESFLSIVKSSLSEQGLFVINLVSRSPAIKDMVFSRLKTVFRNVFHLKLEEDVNEVIFALNSENSIGEEHFLEACHELERVLELESRWSQSIIDTASKIKRLS